MLVERTVDQYWARLYQKSSYRISELLGDVAGHLSQTVCQDTLWQATLAPILHPWEATVDHPCLAVLKGPLCLPDASEPPAALEPMMCRHCSMRVVVGPRLVHMKSEKIQDCLRRSVPISSLSRGFIPHEPATLSSSRSESRLSAASLRSTVMVLRWFRSSSTLS